MFLCIMKSIFVSGRHSGLIVSELISRLSDPGSSPDQGRGVTVCCWARHFALTIPLLTKVYKWVLANLMPGCNPAMD